MELILRRLLPADRGPIREILERTGVFRPEEIVVALELVDAALADPGQNDYTFAVAEGGGRVAGYACWGEAPCTRGTFDLYWIAVDPGLHRRGAGRALVEKAESDMARRSGRLCLIETSSLPVYEATRGFYLRLGYKEEARVHDYYQPGDDRVIYARRLVSSHPGNPDGNDDKLIVDS